MPLIGIPLQTAEKGDTWSRSPVYSYFGAEPQLNYGPQKTARNTHLLF